MDFATFAASPMVVRSVLYSIEVIGEAVKHLSPDFTAARPQIPWRAIAGMRDRACTSTSAPTFAASGTW